MTGERVYWEPEIETMAPAKIRALQLERLNLSLARAAKSPFYGRRFASNRLKPGVASLPELRRFPFTVKDDLRQSYPDGMVCVPHEKLVRLHASSGTTGKSTLIFHTARDIDTWTGIIVRCLWMIGCRPSDIFQNMMSYGLFTGGLGLHYGAERLGMLVVPIAAGNTQRQIQFMLDLGVTAIHITPSYALHFAQVAEEMGLHPASAFKLKRAIMGAEPYSEATRQRLEKLFTCPVYNCYGLSEMNGPGVAFECPEQSGLHLWEDNYCAEIIDPDTGDPVPDGEEGELVLTTLCREGMPIIRYRTRDLTRFMPGKCGCGRTHRRIARLKGRSDDMFIVKGVNVFPSQIETVLMQIPEVYNNYVIVLDRAGGIDVLTVQVEIRREFFTGNLQALRSLQETLRDRLKTVILVTPVVELVEPGSLPPSAGKAQRVIDKRSL